MHWIWSTERSSEEEAAIDGVPAVIKELDLSFDDGVRVEVEVPPIEITQDEDGQGPLTDNLVAAGVGGLTFSSKLRKVLEQCGVDNIDYYPCVLKNLVDGSTNEDYMVANVIGRVACIDKERSDLEMDPDVPDEIEFISSLALDESAIGEMNIFRLDEFEVILAVSEKVMKACTEAGITGVRFYKPEDFSL